MNNNVVALIPARGGSKAIIRKNIKLMNGCPLIAYSIEASLNAPSINRTFVSTDDEEIASIALALGAEVPFLRPKELADDITPDFPVVEHFLDYLEKEEGYIPDVVVFLRPTLPLRNSSEIESAIKILSENPIIDSVRTTQIAPYPPYWMKRINKDGYLEPYDESVKALQFNRRQDLPNIVIGDGYVDATRVSVIRKYRRVVAGNIFAYHRDNIPFVDIDKEENWKYCEYLLSKKTKDHED